MITPLEVYLILKLDDLICLLVFTIVVSAVFFAVTFFSGLFKITEAYDEESKCYGIGIKRLRLSRIPGAIAIISAILVTIIPGTQEMAAILVIPKISNSEAAKVAQKIPLDLVNLADKYMQEKLKDIAGDSDNERK